ncbi:MAG TPA: ATP-binding protein [Candidatus Saccharimonadales bacterium]|jgi:signal transduction histidine kinase
MKPPATWKYVNKGLLVILGIFVLAMLASIFFLSSTLLKLDALTAKSGQSVQTALELQDHFISVLDAESSVRGYLISDDKTVLAPFETAKKEIPDHLREIRQDKHYDVTTEQIKALETVTREKMEFLQRTVDAKAAGDQEAVNAAIASGEGFRLTNRIRGVVNLTTNRSLNGIGPREQQSEDYLQRALGVAGAVSIFVVAICAVLMWYFARTILHVRSMENTKSEFLSLASHQLRTPATNVKQYIGLLLDGYIGTLTSKQRDALQVAYRNNELEIRIMNDLLDVAKLDMKRIQLHRQRINVVSIVRQVVKEYQQYTADHGQKLELLAPKELMANVDRAYFKGVIEKLVDNAVKYSRNDTTVTIKVRERRKDGMFKVIVRDQGLGIHKREVPKLFMKFSRLTNEFSATSEGSGLGLYWVKQIMLLHGGDVRVVSEEGRGSKFTVTAPLT